MQKAIVIFKELTDTDIPIHPFSVITCLVLRGLEPIPAI